MLRGVLFQTGRIQRQMTQIRSAMLGVQRGLSHMCDAAPQWFRDTHVARLQVVLGDLKALAEFDQQMDDKVQFLLDATLGFINNDQNDIIKVLTIVSVVTIPPMILAGIWGMNFKSIPEYNWAYGYAFGLGMIVLSMLLPLAWFKWKRWF
jgi:magnesium transporter